MTLPRGAADEAHAIAVLQHMAAMCDETRRFASSDPSRIEAMLDVFDNTLASLAPVLEAVGQTPGASLSAVLEAMKHASDRHTALIDTMALELERLSRAIADNGHSATASAAYAGASAAAPHAGFEKRA